MNHEYNFNKLDSFHKRLCYAEEPVVKRANDRNYDFLMINPQFFRASLGVEQNRMFRLIAISCCSARVGDLIVGALV